MTGSLVINELKRMWKQAVEFCCDVLQNIRQQQLRKTTKFSG